MGCQHARAIAHSHLQFCSIQTTAIAAGPPAATMFALLLQLLGWVGLAVLAGSFGLYFLLQLLCGSYYKYQNLKDRYRAEWALVTGASTGIGKSLAKRLAQQGLSVVLVALANDDLDATYEELKEAHPHVEFRKVGVDLGRPGYMPTITKATADIDVQVVFCNAGYILSGFFYARSAEQIQANIECNALSAVHITHHFLKRMMDAGLKGCFVFTSSASAVLPSPFAVSYASTKAFLSMFAISLAPEIKWLGIDVLAVHPSPVASRFYDGAAKLGMMEAFKKLAVGPDALPDIIFASVGRTIWKDIGPVALGFRLLEKAVDLNALFTLAAPIMHHMPDFQQQLAALRAAGQ